MSQHNRQRPAEPVRDGRQPLAGADADARAWRDAAPSRAGLDSMLVRRKVFRTWIGADGRTHGRWTWDYL